MEALAVFLVWLMDKIAGGPLSDAGKSLFRRAIEALRDLIAARRDEAEAAEEVLDALTLQGQTIDTLVARVEALEIENVALRHALDAREREIARLKMSSPR